MLRKRNADAARRFNGYRCALATITGLALGLAGTQTAHAGFGAGLALGDGTNNPRDLARTLPLRTELGNRINAQRMKNGQPPLAGDALNDAAMAALEALRCHIEILGELANCQIEDDFGADAGDTWDEMLESGRVCVISNPGYRGACLVDGVADDAGDKINISLEILPFDQKYKDLCALLLAQPSVSSSALTLYEEIRHAQQDWDFPAEGDRSTAARVRQRLKAVCNERDVDDKQLEATCDALDALANLEAGNDANAQTEFGRKIAACLDMVMDDPDTKADERQQAIDKVKGGLKGRKAFTGGVGDANNNGMIDDGEDLNMDGMIDGLGTRACYDAGKQAYQAWLDSAMTQQDLNDLNAALKLISWESAIPGQLGPVNANEPVPGGREPAQLFRRGNSQFISQFLPNDAVDHVLQTPLFFGVRDMIVVPIPGSPVPNILLVGGSIEPGLGGIFSYLDLDGDGIFEQATQQTILVDPLFGTDVAGLVIPPGGSLTELTIILQNNPLFFGNEDLTAYPFVDTNGDGFPDAIGPPLGPPIIDPLPPLGFDPLPNGFPDGFVGGVNVADGTVGDLDDLVLVPPSGLPQLVYRDEITPFPPFPLPPVLPGDPFVNIGAPPFAPVELYLIPPLGPGFDQLGNPLVPPIGFGKAGPDGIAQIPVPPLAEGDILIARLLTNGVLSADIRVGGGTGGPCNPADLVEPFGVLDLADIGAFVDGFLSQLPSGDLNNDGIWDLQDIDIFVVSFLGGCP